MSIHASETICLELEQDLYVTFKISDEKAKSQKWDKK
jgi:hypothetical protein